MKNRKISCTKAEKYTHILSLMEDEYPTLSVKEWSNKTGESKNNYFIMFANLLC